jgi:hypothetical protein
LSTSAIERGTVQSPTIGLSPQQIASYHQNSFLALPARPRTEKRNFYWPAIQRTTRMERRKAAMARPIS